MSSIKIIETLYQAFQKKDYVLLRQICDEDLQWIQNKGFPNGEHHRGIDVVIQKVFKKFDEDWEYFKFNIEEMFESKDGSKVIVIGSYIGKHKSTGKQFDASAAHLYEIKNQKVKTFRQFADTAIIVSALR